MNIYRASIPRPRFTRAPTTPSPALDSPMKLDTWATRPTEAEQHPYRTGKGSGAVFDAGGEWLAGEKRGEFRQPTDPW